MNDHVIRFARTLALLAPIAVTPGCDRALHYVYELLPSREQPATAPTAQRPATSPEVVTEQTSPPVAPGICPDVSPSAGTRCDPMQVRPMCSYGVQTFRCQMVPTGYEWTLQARHQNIGRGPIPPPDLPA
ncbi:MAG: hypothetical protein Q8Q09_03430 [Deltaproteobacteria bacterium]|nr:hypothetical protein [Deltaproteobacteria bacterium]